MEGGALDRKAAPAPADKDDTDATADGVLNLDPARASTRSIIEGSARSIIGGAITSSFIDHRGEASAGSALPLAETPAQWLSSEISTDSAHGAGRSAPSGSAKKSEERLQSDQKTLIAAAPEPSQPAFCFGHMFMPPPDCVGARPPFVPPPPDGHMWRAAAPIEGHGLAADPGQCFPTADHLGPAAGAGVDFCDAHAGLDGWQMPAGAYSLDAQMPVNLSAQMPAGKAVDLSILCDEPSATGCPAPHPEENLPKTI